jgi:archaeal flagellin FlaB
LIKRINTDQKGITGLETAIILIAFVVVASVFAYTVLSAGLFTAGKSQEAVYAGLQDVQGTLEIRGGVIGHKDTLNSGNGGSLGRVDFTVAEFTDSGQVDLTPAYTLDAGSGALTCSNPGANRLQIAFIDRELNVSDCAWTVAFIGRNNADNMLDASEKAVISVWLHTFDGVSWGPPGSEGVHFLGTHYVDTYHEITLEVKAARGAMLTLQRTTPAFLDPVTDLH